MNAFVFHIIHEDIFVYIDINITMNRLGNRYASTTASFLSIYLLLTNWQNKKHQRPKGFMLMNALGARGSSLTFVQADFLSLLFLNWHTQLNQHWKERHMILIFDSHYKSLSFQYSFYTSFNKYAHSHCIANNLSDGILKYSGIYSGNVT